jgi:hypothetical protein
VGGALNKNIVLKNAKHVKTGKINIIASNVNLFQ